MGRRRRGRGVIWRKCLPDDQAGVIVRALTPIIGLPEYSAIGDNFSGYEWSWVIDPDEEWNVKKILDDLNLGMEEGYHFWITERRYRIRSEKKAGGNLKMRFGSKDLKSMMPPEMWKEGKKLRRDRVKFRAVDRALGWIGDE